MTARLMAMVVSVCLCSSLDAQAPASLSRQQRELLQRLLAEVDRAGAPAAAGPNWLLHVLRASDGSHYIAFSLTPEEQSLPDKPIIVYVRLATAVPAGTQSTAERSVVREWLLGSRVDPRLLPQRRGVAVGDMPAMGAGSIGIRGTASVGSGDLQAMALERERSRERREEEERRRKAALEGNVTPDSDRLPFEDFDIGVSAVFPDGTRAIQRALTAGPGLYELSVAWADASQPPAKAQYHVARRSLQLAPAAAEFGLSSIIVADAIGVRQAPHDSLQQRAHPYTIGLTDITPARDATFTPAQQIAVAFQIVNPAVNATGKPDVRVSPRITRLSGTREDTVATLSPLVFDASTLPPEFDVRLGHPLIAAFAAPLATIPRGDYRLLVTAEDRVASTVVAARASFTVAGTPESLLAEAPPFAPRFAPGTVLEPVALADVLTRLETPPTSPALARAFASARASQFADLLVNDAVPDHEQGTRAALSGLALLSLGNPAAATDFQRALQLQASTAAVQVLMGAARAMAGRDAEAIAAWEEARQAGFPRPVLDRLVTEAYLRQKDYVRAAAAIGDRPPDTTSMATFAATRIGTRRPAEAVAVLDALLAERPDDAAARWLLVHALYAQFVDGDRGTAIRLRTEAQRYIDGRGRHAQLASEWLKVVTSS